MSRAAFLKSVHAEPDDDTVRLAFADWLEEHDDAARAEFIRVQVDLARTEPWAEHGVDLSIRERQLLHEHRRAWLDEVPKWVPRKDARFARGLLSGITCTATKYLEIADRLPSTVVRELNLTQFNAGVAFAVAATSHLARARSLSVRDDSWSSVPALLSSRHLANLRSLTLVGSRGERDFLTESFRTLAGLPALGSLERLSLTVTRWYTDTPPPAGVGRAVAGLPLANLRSLHLDVSDLDREQLRHLLASPVAANLAEFRLPNSLSAGAVCALRDAAERPGLRAFRFGAAHDYRPKCDLYSQN